MDISFLGILFFILLPLDEALWSYVGPFFIWRLLAPHSAGLVTTAFIAVFTVRLFVFYRAFTWRGGCSPATRKWVVAICTLGCGLPLESLIIVPAWRWLETHQPRWALSPKRKNEKLSLLGPANRLRLFLVRAMNPEISPTTYITLFVGSWGTLFLLSFWLARQAERDSLEYRVTIAASVTLHLVAFAVAIASLSGPDIRRNTTRLKYFSLMACSFTLLAPVPYLPIVGILAVLALSPPMRSETLVWSAYAQNTEPERLPLWWKLESSLRKEWRRFPLLKRIWNPPHSITRQSRISDSEAKIIKLYNFKALFLALDAACLAWGLFWLGESQRSWIPVLQALYFGLFWGSLLLASAAFLTVVSHRFLMQLRISGPLRLFDRQPYPTYILRTQLSLMAGIFFGAAYHQGDPLEIGKLLALFCGLLIVVQAMGIMLKPRETKARWESTGPRGFLPIYGTLLALAVLGALGVSIKPFLVLWLISYPMRVLLMGRWLLPWLLRPFSWKSIFNSAFPYRLRTRLVVLALAATLPFGGLAIPLCLYIRDRWWAEALAVWAQSNSNDGPIRDLHLKPSLANLQLERSP